MSAPYRRRNLKNVGQRENPMNGRSSRTQTAAGFLFLLGVAFAGGGAVAQQAADMDAVKAANQAFYAALSARDVWAMQKVWSSDVDIQI
jgi:hypothetical protein